MPIIPADQDEPRLADLLAEPIIAALMESDGVDRDWLEKLMSDVGTGHRDE